MLAPGVRVTGQLNELLCSDAETPLQVTVDTPDSASDAEPVTETVDVLRVAPLAGEVMLSTGAVLSIFSTRLVVAEFPAASVAVPVTGWFAPSVLSVTGEGQATTGAVPAAHTKPIVTFELFHPAPFGAGVPLATIVGGLVPMFSVSVAVAEFPATSVTVPVTV